MSDEPPIPDPLANLDQILRGLVDVARTVRGYHTALLDAGFSEDQALALTLSFQMIALQGGRTQE